MLKKLIIIIYFIPILSLSETVHTFDEFNNKLNANYASSKTSQSVILLVHGTRGHKKLELINTLVERLSENNIDSLAINLSYGLDDRKDDFLSCDIVHNYLNKDSLKEIKIWFDFLAKKNKYKNIILLGHSRGGLNIMQFYSTLNYSEKDLVKNVALLAPISDNFENTVDKLSDHPLINEIKLGDLPSNEIIKIDFLSCQNARVEYSTFNDYYNIKQKGTRSSASLLGLLKRFTVKMLIVTASDDTITPLTHNRVDALKQKNITLIEIDGSDHFFRDLYFDDMFDELLEFIQ